MRDTGKAIKKEKNQDTKMPRSQRKIKKQNTNCELLVTIMSNFRKRDSVVNMIMF